MKKKPNGYWTYERCKEEALKFNKRRDFIKECSSAFNVIIKNKWDELLFHIQYEIKPKGYWTYDRCKEEVLKYNNLKDFISNSSSSYNVIKINNWNELLIYDETKNPKGYWTYERCKELSSSYHHRKDFRKDFYQAYDKIIKNNWNELFSHMELVGNRYNRLLYIYIFSDMYFYVGLTGNINRRRRQHMCDITSSVYKHMIETNIIPELIIKSEYIDVEKASIQEGVIYNEYIDNGFKPLNKIKTGGIGGNQIKWDYESCKNEALLYSKRIDFQRGSASAYHASRKNKWLDIFYKKTST